jgi:hypothetical protein
MTGMIGVWRSFNPGGGVVREEGDRACWKMFGRMSWEIEVLARATRSVR